MQYFYYIVGIFQGNMGVTFSGQSVNDVLARTLPVTARLAIMAIAIEFTLAIIIGTISALRKGKLFDNTALVIALIFVAVPIFVLAFVAQYFLAIQLGLVQARRSERRTTGATSGCRRIVLGVSLYATSMRLMRGSVIDTLNQDWVRTAYSKGLSRNRVIPVHALRNSLIPVITNTRHQLRRAAGRRDRHRGHLQRPRRRQHAVPGDPGP